MRPVGWLKARHVGLAIVVAIVTLFGFASIASAHVTVWPRTSTTKAYEKYTVRVPTEKEVPTVKIELKFPAGLTVTNFEPVPGWTYQIEKDASGNTTGVIWSGGKIPVGAFQEFAFLASNPAEPANLAFKAYQTYADGSVVDWTGPAGSATPASVVQITAASTAATAGTNADPNVTSNSAPLGQTGTFWLSIAALVVSALALGSTLLVARALRSTSRRE